MKYLLLIFFTVIIGSNASFAYDVEVLYRGDQVVWGFDFIDDKTVIFTERIGRLKTLDLKNNKVTEIKGLPVVRANGQGGLLDVRVRNKNKIYISYSEPVGSDKATTAIALADFDGSQLLGFRKIFTGLEASSKNIHFGSRIDFDNQGHVFFGMGDRDDRHLAQKLEFNNGKIMRLNEDGSVPTDNPFVKTSGARPEIWSYGHRNPQGLVWNSKTSELWEAEFGPRGDEINLIQSGRNYGWPIITYGKEYWGPSIGEGTEKAGMEQPVTHYVPSISPSGMCFYYGTQFPKWNGNLFVANLSSTHIRRLVIENRKVISQEELVKDKGWRFRQVRQGPDGFLYFSTDLGLLGRLVPKK